MAKYATFSPLYQNSNLGTASRNFQNTMFGGGGGGTSELDPSQIYANEQLAMQRKNKAALDQQKHQATADFMTSPDYHYTGLNSNSNQWNQGLRTQAGTNQIANILANPDTTDEQRAQAIYSGYLGETMPAGGFYSGTREDQFARDQQRLLDQNAANNARTIATNQADNARTIATNQADNESNLARSLFDISAGNTAIIPRATVQQYLGLGPDSELPSGFTEVGDGNIQFTAPAKPTTSGSGKTPPTWTNTADWKMRDKIASLLDPDSNDGFPELDADQKRTRHFGLSEVPTELFQSLFPVIQQMFNNPDSQFYGKSDQAAEEVLRQLVEPGVTKIPDTDGEMFSGSEVFVPTFWMNKVKKNWAHHTSNGDQQKAIQTARSSLRKAGYDDLAITSVINFLKANQ